MTDKIEKLREKIEGMLYERTAISKKPEEVAQLEIEKLRNTLLLCFDQSQTDQQHAVNP